MHKLLAAYPSLGKGFVRVRKQGDGDDIGDLDDDDIIDDINERIGERDAGEQNDGEAGSASARHISHLASLVSEATGAERQVALDWLLHTRAGLMLIQRTLGKRLNKRKEQTMTREQELAAIAKRFDGLATICKHVVDRGSTTISEHELSAVIGEVARREYPNATAAGAFAKLFNEDGERGVLLRRAVQIAKGFSTAGPTRTAAAGGTAYDALMLKAEELAKRTGLSREQSFSKVFSDPANRELAARERSENRPTAA
jgi:hypothetical protein